MYFALLIHTDAAVIAQRTPEEMQQHGAGVERFDAEITEAGQNLGSVRLAAAEDARLIRVRRGRIESTDGPFAETKEQLGGIYLLDAPDAAAAEAIAARLPMAELGTVEVRPCAGVDLRGQVSSWE